MTWNWQPINERLHLVLNGTTACDIIGIPSTGHIPCSDCVTFLLNIQNSLYHE